MIIGIDARMYGTEAATGIGQYIKQLTDHLFAIDSENQYVLFLREPQYSKFTPPNDRVKKALVTPRWYTYAEQIKLPLELAKEKIDLIHYPHFNSPILYPKKSVCTIHDLTPFYFPGHKMKSKIRRYGYNLVFQATVKKANKVIAVSQSTKDGIVETFKVPETKVKVVYEGVDERFKIIENDGIITSVKERYGITKPYIFYVGVWRNHKNLEGLISAFEIVKKSQPELQLVLAGQEDTNYPDIRQKIDDSPVKAAIITPGYIPDNDLPLLYNGANVFVIPSFIEGFGLIGIEAQACGTPVASTNTSSMPEVLGDAAVYFDPNNHSEMASALLDVITDRDKQALLREQGLENVQRFSWHQAAKETLEIYQEIYHGKKNSSQKNTETQENSNQEKIN